MLFIRYKTREAQLKMDLQLKQMEKQNIEISHNMGVQMFTNFSHELRTPLTLIIAPLTDLLHKEDMPPAYRQPLELINRNSQRFIMAGKPFNGLSQAGSRENATSRQQLQSRYLHT